GKRGNRQGIPGLFPGGEVTAVFSLRITNIASGVPVVGNVLTFAPDPVFEGFYGTGAMAAIFENDSGRPLTADLAAGGGATGTYFADAQAGVLNAIAGFTGAGGTATGGEGWTGTASTLVFPPTTGLTGEYTGNVDLLPGLLPGGTYAPGTAGADLTFPFSEPNSQTGTPGFGGFTQ